MLLMLRLVCELGLYPFFLSAKSYFYIKPNHQNYDKMHERKEFYYGT